MTPSDLAATLATLGLSRKELAERLGVHPVTVRKWMAGMKPIPHMVELVLTAEARALAAEARAERAEAALTLYRRAVVTDLKVNGEFFNTANISALRVAWEHDRAALTPTGE